MSTFHKQIVASIDVRDLPHLRKHCYVFPTKRGGVFFKQVLLKRFHGHHFFLPAILSIEEFIEQMTGWSVTDELTLLFELHQIYQKQEPDLDFDRFYAWGKIILRDYDEIDRYMADAKKIYQGLQELKEIEASFSSNEEIRNIVAHFRSVTDQKEKTEILTRFLKVWKAVGTVYIEFQHALEKKQHYYSGMLYKQLAEAIVKTDFEHPFEHYHICGFNALSKAEELIFDQLVKTGKGQLYWDVDTLYLEDKREEAGNFLRTYQKKWPDTVWIKTTSVHEPKRITIAGVPQHIGQAHIATQLLKEGRNKEWKPEETALVLADEKLLLPVLYALPLQNNKVNVTMGYPVKFTAAYDFIESYLEIFRKSHIKNEEILVYTQDLKRLLSNAYLSIWQPRLYENFEQWAVREKQNRMTLTTLKKQIPVPVVRELFNTGQSWRHIFAQAKKYLTAVFYHFKNGDNSIVDREFIYFFLKTLNQVTAHLESRKGPFSLKLIQKIIREYFKTAKIPFEGEPVEGFQVMGFLETRTLDFKHVIVLSANEGVIPSQRTVNTYIPYALRKAFSLPTFEEQDAIYAYHFKRLIQRAENVHFIYDNEVSKDSSGEQSRFVLQLLQKYKPHPNIRIDQRQYTGKLNQTAVTPKAIKIEKTKAVFQMMQRYLAGSEEDKFLSPTSLTTYITCKLRFYFQYILRIHESEDLEEDIDARDFGIVTHLVLEELYKPWTAQEIHADDIKRLEKLVTKKVEEVLETQKVVQPFQELYGKDLLTKKIMERLVLKILQMDQEHTPFTIIGLEHTDFQKQIPVGNGDQVRLGGTVDRIDVKDRTIRIIDYKTGKVTLPSASATKKPTEEYIDAYFQNPLLKSGFQGYFYGLLASTTISEKTFKIGIIGMRELSKGVQWLRGGNPIAPELMQYFEFRLTQLVNDIYDPRVPFTQTEDEGYCQYCPYNRICNRS